MQQPKHMMMMTQPKSRLGSLARKREAANSFIVIVAKVIENSRKKKQLKTTNLDK
jgi:hypothetical protein